MAYMNLTVIFLYLLTAIISAGHALIYKRDSRSSLIWIILSLILPFIGSLSYYLFGINRIERLAKKLPLTKVQSDNIITESQQSKNTRFITQKYQYFVHITDVIESRPLLFGNKVSLLRHGDVVYPSMLKAIHQSKELIVLSTYIFDNDFTGNEFVDALSQARSRGVNVYVLIDGVGALYSFPSIIAKLKKAHIKYAKFLPLKLFPPSFSLNLRNHRKILVVDQSVGFTGGINISDRHRKIDENKRKVSDMHFIFHGPIVGQLYDLFCSDWFMSTGEKPSFKPSKLFRPSSNDVPCRVIADGPDEDINKLSMILHSAICAANESVLIMTPYFIPSREMIAIMLAAANRGIMIKIILPEKSNLSYVDAATRNLLWELLEWNISIFYQPPPFEHGKLIVIDNCYVLIGSANIDPRSLRLNFELMVEILDQKFAQQMTSELIQIIDKSCQITFKEVESRSLFTRIKDSFFWLFSPYL